MGFLAAPSIYSGVFALSALAGSQAMAEAARLRHAVIETFTCANLSPGNDTDPEAVAQIGRAIALVHNSSSLPPGTERARLVLRLCFHESISNPILEVADYSGPYGEAAYEARKAAETAVLRALKAGTLTKALAALSGGRPQDAVVDLAFGPVREAGE